MYSHPSSILPVPSQSACVADNPLDWRDDLNVIFAADTGTIEFISQLLHHADKLTDASPVLLEAHVVCLHPDNPAGWNDVLDWLKSAKFNAAVLASLAPNPKGKDAEDGLLFAAVTVDPDDAGVGHARQIDQLRGLGLPVVSTNGCNDCMKKVARGRDPTAEPRHRLRVRVVTPDCEAPDLVDLRSRFTGLQQNACLYVVPVSEIQTRKPDRWLSSLFGSRNGGGTPSDGTLVAIELTGADLPDVGPAVKTVNEKLRQQRNQLVAVRWQGRDWDEIGHVIQQWTNRIGILAGDRKPIIEVLKKDETDDHSIAYVLVKAPQIDSFVDPLARKDATE